ncbi:unnamed protein product, partial [Brassica napus]
MKILFHKCLPIKDQRQSRRRCNLLRGIARTLPQPQDDTCGVRFMMEHGFMMKVRQCGASLSSSLGFDIEHLMKTKPGCCNLWASETTKDKPAPEDIFLYARLGIHKYNMIQGTNLQLHGIEKYNMYCKARYSIHYVTAVAKDPAASGSLVTFQTKFYEEGFDFRRLTCSIARPKPGPHGNTVLALILHCKYEPSKSVYSSDENIVVPNERLNARNAIFYIKYKYCPNKNKAHGFKATRDRIAIVRRNLDKFSGDITLSFD